MLMPPRAADKVSPARIAPSMAVAPQQDNLKLWVRDSVETGALSSRWCLPVKGC